MKKEDHLEKAKRIEQSIHSLDNEKDWELIVEGVYGCAQHYIAYITESNVNEHKETHKGLIKFLKEKGLNELADLFQTIDELRMGKWYGNQANGHTVEIALLTLDKIKEFTKHGQ